MDKTYRGLEGVLPYMVTSEYPCLLSIAKWRRANSPKYSGLIGMLVSLRVVVIERITRVASSNLPGDNSVGTLRLSSERLSSADASAMVTLSLKNAPYLSISAYSRACL